MGSARGLKQVGYFDCSGGGQVVVDNGIAYIGHMRAPTGTSIIDVKDPKNPKLLASLQMPEGSHSHKVRVQNGIMIINREINFNDKRPLAPGFKGGFAVYDVSKPAAPKELHVWKTEGQGVHRYDFDGNYLYFSSTLEGYQGNIVMIMDLADPAQPKEVGRWWMPGQWIAGGEKPTWKGIDHRCHHPLRMGNRLYVSYWLGGFVILNIEDMSKPKFISGLDWSPPFKCPTHTALPIPFDIHGRRYLLVADEDVYRQPSDPPAFIWMVDITDEKHPVPVSSFQVDGVQPGVDYPTTTACHQPCEKVTSTEIPSVWFSNGLRIIDIANPQRIKEVAHLMPDIPDGEERVQSNDLTVDDKGLIYVIDRRRGLSIVERT